MLVFQYGSNCLDSQINGSDRLCGDASLVDIAVAEDFELSFDVWSKGRQCAASNIIPRKGSVAWGVLYEIPDFLMDRASAKRMGRKSMDAIEGEGTNYERRKIQVRKPSGEVVEAVTYTVIEREQNILTNAAYVGHILEGLREHGVPNDYIERVKSIAIANNPAIAASLEDS
jgi:hypothetical protein